MTTTTKTKRSLRWNRFAGVALAFLQFVPSSLAQSNYEKCVATLIVSDTSKNSMLNKDPEYLMFLNVLTEFQYNFEAFDSLSSSLQMNFEIFQESDGVIDIRAATHGEEASPRQKRVVETFCTTTFAALSSLPTIARNATNIPNSTASLPPVLVRNETNAHAPPKNTTFSYPLETETETELPETDMPETDMPETDSPMPSEAPTTAPPTKSPVVTTAFSPELVAVSLATKETAPKVGSAANVTSTAKEAKPVTNVTNDTNVTNVTPSSIEPPPPASTGNLSVVANVTDIQANATTATSHVTVVTRLPIQATTITDPPSQASASPTTLAPTTVAPSTAPTASPTKGPTSSPTRTPTATPTGIPTAPPTRSTPNETLTFTASESINLPFNVTNQTSSPNVSPTASRTVSPANITRASGASPTASPIALNETVLTNDTDAATNTGTHIERVTIFPTEDAWAASSDDPYSDCKNVMKFSDVNEDGTMNKLEYVWFINDSWNNPYPGVAFKNLPQSLKDNFDNLANKGGIDISAVNSQEEVSSENEEFLNKICADTEDAVAREEPNEDNVAEGANMDTFKDCLVSVTLFDANRDTVLDENEYAALISQLSNGVFGKGGFGSLPLVLQDSFFALAISGSMDLRGAREGTKLSSSQQELLEEICIELSYAMNEATQNLDGQENGTVVDYAETDAEAMLVYAACFMGMDKYDEDQDLNLDQEEYVKLVNHLGKNQFYNMTFEELHQVLQDNFWNLETDGAININGSGTDEFPDNEQRQFLGRVCSETTDAISMALEDVDPSTPPADTPNTVEAVPSSMDSIVIHSSFHIYSDVWIPEEEFETGETRQNLEEAYKIFAADVVNGLVQEKQSTNRRLGEDPGEGDDEPSIVLDPESPSITKMIDLNCMSSGSKSVCKTVFAQYEIIPSVEMDRDAIYEEYVRVTQSFIDSGLLERDLDQVNPESLIAVIGASEPVIYTPPEATTNPAESIPLYSESDSDKEGGNKKKKIISMSAVAFACLLLLSVVALVYVRYRKRSGGSLSTSRNSSLRGSGSLGKSPSDTADDHDRSQTGGSQAGSGGSDGTPKSNIFRSRCGDTESDEEDMATRDEELGRMQVIDLCEGASAPATPSNDYDDDVNNGLLRGFGANNNGSNSAGSGGGFGFPPLRKKMANKGDELGSSASEEMSFAFRRYAMDGGKVNTEDEDDHTAVI